MNCKQQLKQLLKELHKIAVRPGAVLDLEWELVGGA